MKNYTFITILLAIFFGVMAGLAAQIIGSYYLSENIDSFTLTREFDLLDNRQSSLIIRDPRKVVVSQDAKIEETKELINASFYSLYNLDQLTSDYLFLDEPYSLAMAVSSDAWLIAFLPQEIVNYSQEKIIENFRLVSSDRVIYNLSEALLFSKDSLNILFFKAEDLNNLSVLNTADTSQLKSAQSLLAYQGENKMSLSSLVDNGYLNQIFSSDSFNRDLSVKTKENSYIFDLSGNLVGFVDYENNFHPSLLLDLYWRSFLKEGEIVKPFLGIHYLNLSQTRFLDNNYSRGAMIYGSQDFPAFLEDSPAIEAGLEEGDVISEVDGLPINDNLDLAEYILTLNSGDEINLNYYRQGEKSQISIILK